jgi:hypothetical protein
VVLRLAAVVPPLAAVVLRLAAVLAPLAAALAAVVPPPAAVVPQAHSSRIPFSCCQPAPILERPARPAQVKAIFRGSYGVFGGISF